MFFSAPKHPPTLSSSDTFSNILLNRLRLISLPNDFQMNQVHSFEFNLIKYKDLHLNVADILKRLPSHSYSEFEYDIVLNSFTHLSFCLLSDVCIWRNENVRYLIIKIHWFYVLFLWSFDRSKSITCFVFNMTKNTILNPTQRYVWLRTEEVTISLSCLLHTYYVHIAIIHYTYWFCWFDFVSSNQSRITEQS